LGYGIRLKVWSDYACFTRPEMKAERVSYDVMTPSAARGVLDAIHWKPAIRWVVDAITVLNEIKFDNIRRNEVSAKVPKPSEEAMRGGPVAPLGMSASDNRQQRATLYLWDVAYVIEAHFELTDRAGPEDTAEKHYNIALRRMREGQCFHRPYLGCREFPAHFELVEGDMPPSFYKGKGEADLGWMLQEIDFDQGASAETHIMTSGSGDKLARFFRAKMVDGRILVPPKGGGEA
jgi:CRISPR-associated protein Cas5d